MRISEIFDDLRRIALNEFGDMVASAEVEALPTGDPRKLRLHLIDDTFVDIFLSVSGRYSYHWQRTAESGDELYRHDNAPHTAWRSISTYPKHFHEGSQQNVVASHLNDQPSEALREFCAFVRHKLRQEAG